MRRSTGSDEPIRAEIDLACIAENTRILKSHAGEAHLMAVVKADGYGHGAVEVAKTSLKNGATWLAVARLCEALALRRAGIEAPILILGVTPASGVPELIQHRIRQTIASETHAKELSAAAQQYQGELLCHFKLDTGMGRLGFDVRNSACTSAVCEAYHLPALCPEGIFTHIATADEADLTSARLQADLFLKTLDALESLGCHFSLCHGANSASLFTLPHLKLGMVRAGISLYGMNPSDEVPVALHGLRAALSLKGTIVHVKTLQAGQSVSYGATWTATEPCTIATVSCGYGDGYPRRLSGLGRMVVKGQSAPIVGRVCMDMTMIDVTGIENVKAGDEVVILGEDGRERVSVEEIARVAGTINYEVTCLITSRVPRVYL